MDKNQTNNILQQSFIFETPEPSNDIENRIQYLKDEINKSNYKYYVEENPYLTDFEADFDAEWLATAEQVC